MRRAMMMVPKPIIYILISMSVLAMVPPALIARARTRTQSQRRIHFIQDMDNQASFRAQHANLLFADGRAMRRPVAGTVARGELAADDHFERGIDARAPAAADTGVHWATTFPSQAPLTRELVERGRDRFTIYCTPCHGQAGYGDGIIHQRAMLLMSNPLIGNGTSWVQPKSLHDPLVRDLPVGQIFSTITNGVRTMAAYAAQVPVADRWAIVAYIEALQRSQRARPSDLTDVQRARVENMDPIDLMPDIEETPE